MKITVYHKRNCLPSKMVLKYLKKRKVFYIAKSVEENLVEYESYGYTSSPLCVVEKNGEKFIEVGFNDDVKTILDMII